MICKCIGSCQDVPSTIIKIKCVFTAIFPLAYGIQKIVAATGGSTAEMSMSFSIILNCVVEFPRVFLHIFNKCCSKLNNKMKVLSEDRTRKLFEKLTKYIGVNVKLLIDRPDGTYCFREKKDRVYYISERLLQLAQTVKPDHLVSAGTCFGKFTKTNKFRLHITALTYIAPYAPFKIWLKPSAEQQFLYGHHVIKSGLGRITENTPKHQGVVINTMSDIPIGFGVVARSTAECRNADPLATIAFHQADIGEYIRSEDTLV